MLKIILQGIILPISLIFAGYLFANTLNTYSQDQAYQRGYDAATQQIRLQLERGHQQDYRFELSQWPDIHFFPRGDRDGVNYKFKQKE